MYLINLNHLFFSRRDLYGIFVFNKSAPIFFFDLRSVIWHPIRVLIWAFVLCSSY